MLQLSSLFVAAIVGLGLFTGVTEAFPRFRPNGGGVAPNRSFTPAARSVTPTGGFTSRLAPSQRNVIGINPALSRFGFDRFINTSPNAIAFRNQRNFNEFERADRGLLRGERNLYAYDAYLNSAYRYGYNPYGYYGSGYNPYAMGYGGGGYGVGYGPSYSDYSSTPATNYPPYVPYTGLGPNTYVGNDTYGANMGAPTGGAISAGNQSYGSAGASAPTQPPPISPLTAFGIPNENGAVKWPLAFRLLPPDQKKELADKADTLLTIATSQAITDRANPVIVREANRTVAQMHEWLRLRRGSMAEGTYTDGEVFLLKLDRALSSLGS